MRRCHLAISVVALAACSSKDPFTGNPDGPPGGDAAVPRDGTTGDTSGPHQCVAAPKRIVILGDSITACSVIGGPNSADCVSKQFSDYVIAHYGTGASYENHAVGGAKLADIAGQLAGVPATQGPTLVMMFIGGNDLAPYIFQSDTAAMQAWTQTVQPLMISVYSQVFTTLADPTKFPGGATLLMNTQYNPFDDCAAPPYNVSLAKSAVLGMFNDQIVAIANQHPVEALVVDQHGPYLGHGHCYAQTSCPHYIANAAPYMQDLIHANAVGNAELAGVDNGGADRLYRDCTP